MLNHDPRMFDLVLRSLAWHRHYPAHGSFDKASPPADPSTLWVARPFCRYSICSLTVAPGSGGAVTAGVASFAVHIVP